MPNIFGKPPTPQHINSIVETYPSQPGMMQHQVEGLGREMFRMAETVPHPSNGEWHNHWSKVQEDLKLADNTALYTTAVAGFIEKAFRPELVIGKYIKNLSLNLRGNNSIKIPKGVNLTASAVATDGTVTASDQDLGSLTITLGWIGVRTTIVHQLLQVANVDLIADKLEEIGWALGYKYDYDVFAEIVKAGTKDDATYGDNSNYKYMGASTTISFAGLTEAFKIAGDLYAKPKTMFVNPTGWYNMVNETDIKAAIKWAMGPQGEIPTVQKLWGTTDLIVSPMVPANKMILSDQRLGYVVDGGPVQTWDGRIDTKVAFEILGVKAYGVGIVRPTAVTVIHENGAEPS